MDKKVHEIGKLSDEKKLERDNVKENTVKTCVKEKEQEKRSQTKELNDMTKELMKEKYIIAKDFRLRTV